MSVVEESVSTTIADVGIVGLGPAGWSAAITARVRAASVILVGSGENQFARSHEIDNYPGLPGISGADLAEKFRAHAASLGVAPVNERISEIERVGDHWELFGKQENYRAYSVILATGVMRAQPYQGEKELVGEGVHYCVTCDGRAYRGKTVAVIIDNEEVLSEVELLARLAEHVYLLPLKAITAERQLPENVGVYNAQPVAMMKTDRGLKLVTNRETLDVDGIFVLRTAAPAWQLLPGVTWEKGRVIVDRQQRTSVEGVWAAGDITGGPYQFAKAVGEGNVAAIGASVWAVEQKRAAQNLPEKVTA